jgi:hypothetical protein
VPPRGSMDRSRRDSALLALNTSTHALRSLHLHLRLPSIWANSPVQSTMLKEKCVNTSYTVRMSAMPYWLLLFLTNGLLNASSRCLVPLAKLRLYSSLFLIIPHHSAFWVAHDSLQQLSRQTLYFFPPALITRARVTLHASRPTAWVTTMRHWTWLSSKYGACR